MRTSLIQRASFEDREHKKGIDSIISLDYMGSSEFEWGALPDSLDLIRDNIDEYTYLDVPIADKVITVFCKDSQKSDVKEYLSELSKNNMRLQEYSDFNQYVRPSEYELKWQQKRPHKIDFWWDIQNNLMFWKKNNEFETKFKLIIHTKPK